MNVDYGQPFTALRGDGGMTANNLPMLFLADVRDVAIVRPLAAETVSLARPAPLASQSTSGSTWTAQIQTGTRPPNGSRA